MKKLILTLAMVYVAIFTENAAGDTLLLQEDWQGAVDPAKWHVDGASTFRFDLGLTEQGASGDYAYWLRDGSYSYTTGIRSAVSFNRSDALVVTFKLFRDNAPMQYTTVNGPWVNVGILSGAYPTLEQIEAGMSRHESSHLYYVEGTSSWATVPFSTAYYDAFAAAVTKEQALTVKVTLGEASGAKYEWSIDGENFITEFDTIGDPEGFNWGGANVVSSSDEVWLYFGAAGNGTADAAAIIDDIFVYAGSVTDPWSWLTLEDITPQGTYYQVMVPDTLDLAERAKISVQGLTNFLDPDDEYSTYCHTYFNTNPAYMTRYWAGGKPQNWGKIVEALILARMMCGSTVNLDIERETIKGVINFANPYEPLPTPLSRIMLALMALYNLSPDSEISDLLSTYAQAHIDLAQFSENYAYYYDGPPDLNNTELGVPGYWIQMFVNGTALRAMSRWYNVAEDPSILIFTEKLKNFLLKPLYWQPEASPKVVVGAEHAHFSGHTHSYTQALMGLVNYAELTNDSKLKQFVRDGYEFIRTFGIARIGLFGELCATGDMTYLAIKLSDWGVGDYWEDVDQYVRNHLTELQYRDPTLMQSLVNQMPALDYGQSQPTIDSTDNIVNRTVGLYFSDGSHPALIPQHTMMAVICCTGNCTKALYMAWEGIVRYQEGVAQINLLLNRVSPWLDIDSYLPYEGKVIIRNKKTHIINVRIPRWVHKPSVTCYVNDVSVAPVWTGNYLGFNGLMSGDEIRVEFPVVEVTETYTLKWKEDDYWQESTNPGSNWTPLTNPDVFTCRFKGNTLVEITPRPVRLGYPLYDGRSCYDAPQTPLVTVDRFVANYIFQPGDCVDKPSSDLDGDCKVTFNDFAIMTSQWLHDGVN